MSKPFTVHELRALGRYNVSAESKRKLVAQARVEARRSLLESLIYDGHSVSRIAMLLGVTKQRVSAMVRQGPAMLTRVKTR